MTAAAAAPVSGPVPMRHLAGGVVGGVTSTLLLHPLDLIKIRFAADDGGRQSTRGLLPAFTGITQTEGYRGLYRGVTPNLWGAGASWGFYFMFYNSIKSWMQSGDDTHELGAARHLLVASEAGILTLALTNPLSVARTRLCLQSPKDAKLPEHKRFKGMLDALWKTYKAEGARGLYRGFLPGVWGVSHGALQFMAYEELKTSYNRYHTQPTNSRLNTAAYLQCAALSKLFAAIITYPYQVVRARLQDHRASYAGSMDVIRRVMWQDGVRGMYRGMFPYLLHVMPNVCCVFLIYEMIAGSAGKDGSSAKGSAAGGIATVAAAGSGGSTSSAAGSPGSVSASNDGNSSNGNASRLSSGGANSAGAGSAQ